jgi:Asp/Glu/hydantoin racemase
MRLLLVNPNVTQAITDTMAAEARRAASPGTEITAVTARFGTLYVENRVEAAVAAHAVVETLAEHGRGCAAAIIAAFGDPGLAAAKELMDIPVVGVSEAALLIAYLLGRRYSIVCLTPRLRTWYMECAREHDLSIRLASVRALNRPVPDSPQAREALREPLIAACQRAIDEDDAEVIIVGGGPIAGLAREIADRLPVPTLDGVSCAVRLAETLVALDLRAPERGSFARPGGKPSRGLSSALAGLLGGGTSADSPAPREPPRR